MTDEKKICQQVVSCHGWDLYVKISWNFVSKYFDWLKSLNIAKREELEELAVDSLELALSYVWIIIFLKLYNLWTSHVFYFRINTFSVHYSWFQLKLRNKIRSLVSTGCRHSNPQMSWKLLTYLLFFFTFFLHLIFTSQYVIVIIFKKNITADEQVYGCW